MAYQQRAASKGFPPNRNGNGRFKPTKVTITGYATKLRTTEESPEGKENYYNLFDNNLTYLWHLFPKEMRNFEIITDLRLVHPLKAYRIKQ